MPGTSSPAAPLLVALAKLGLSSEQLSRITGKLVVELQQCRLQHQTACCTVEVSLHWSFSHQCLNLCSDPRVNIND